MVQVFDLIQHKLAGLASAQDYEQLRNSNPNLVPNGQQCLPAVGEQIRASLIGYMVIPRDNIPDALLNSGPLTVALDASQSTFHFYRAGLYHDEKCSEDSYNHHALLVGYSAEPTETPSYLVRNSFGVGWGEGGFMQLLKDPQRNKCLPQNLAIFPSLVTP